MIWGNAEYSDHSGNYSGFERLGAYLENVVPLVVPDQRENDAQPRALPRDDTHSMDMSEKAMVERGDTRDRSGPFPS